ncbi:MAG: 1-acyl-sn-glycerol-3-phosphate acyltransferase [Gemmatimonadetes bacterium]|nr:MAG: 1-acyl-sn-glycerol-3-phosphate acyltransferase [Gemmatimonadota bacterium]
MILYRLSQGLVRVSLPLLGVRFRVEGLEHVPRAGAFLLLFNHQSILDPILAQTACPRVVYSMTKSTQFASPLMRWLVPRLGGFPTRRYQVDPQTVRTALRHLAAGRPVGIYPEGERSWDGHLQPFRRGTMRLVLKAGVPVIPCGIRGSYEVKPRWGTRLARGEVTVRFGRPLHIPPARTRAEREARIDETAGLIAEALNAAMES